MMKAIVRILVLAGALLTPPAFAKPTQCWFQQTENAKSLPPSTCDLRAVGSDTSKLTSNDGMVRTIRLFHDGVAIVVLNDVIYRSNWLRDGKGDIRIIFSDSEFIFRP